MGNHLKITRIIGNNSTNFVCSIVKSHQSPLFSTIHLFNLGASVTLVGAGVRLQATRAMTVVTSVLVLLIGNILIEVNTNTIQDSFAVLDHQELYNQPYSF